MSDDQVVSGYRIEQAIAAWQSARSRLLSDDADLAHDEAALTELLGAEGGNVQDILTRLLRATVHAEAMAGAAADQIEAIRGRQERYKRRAAAMRTTVFAIMDITGQKRVELPDVTVSIAAGSPSAVITDEEALPEEYVRTKREPNKSAILADLKVGVVIAGAQLSNGTPRLMLRVK